MTAFSVNYPFIVVSSDKKSRTML